MNLIILHWILYMNLNNFNTNNFKRKYHILYIIILPFAKLSSKLDNNSSSLYSSSCNISTELSSKESSSPGKFSLSDESLSSDEFSDEFSKFSTFTPSIELS